MRGERLHGENHGRLKSLDAIVEEIRAGGTLEAGSDCFRYGGRSSTGKEYFTHEHEAHRRGKVRANEEFVRERVAWLVLNRRQALEDGVGELLSGRERLEPTGGYRDKLRKSPGDDAANRVAQIETQDKELLERAHRSVQRWANGTAVQLRFTINPLSFVVLIVGREHAVDNMPTAIVGAAAISATR